MSSFKFSQLFNSNKTRLENDFSKTLSATTIKQGQRVKHRHTKELGTCIFTGQLDGSFRVPVISVEYDNGSEAIMVPAEEFTQACRY